MRFRSVVDSPWWHALRALGVGLALAKQAVAEPTHAIADRLFEEGRIALQQGQYSVACSKLSASQRLEPATGTLLNLALCHEAAGRVATAWLEYHEALEHARRDQQSDRVAIAEARLAALSPLLSYLTLEVPATARVPELHIQLDGRPIALAAWGTPLLIDPGTHRVEVRAPGHHSLAVDFETKGNSQRQSMQIPTLALVAPSPATPKTSNAPPADTARQRVRGAGIALIVVGATSALAGAYFGLRANAAWNERNEHCRGGRCDAFAVTRWRDAQRFAAFSTGACVLSALAGGTGAYLTISSARRSAPNSPGGTSFALGWTGQL